MTRTPLDPAALVVTLDCGGDSAQGALPRRQRHHQLGVLVARGRAGPRPGRAQPRTSSLSPLPDAAERLTGDVRRRRVGAARRSATGPFDAVVDWVAFTPDQVRAHIGPVPRAGRAVRLHQLGVGVPDAARAAAGDGVHAAAQPATGSTPATRSRARTCWSRATATRATPSRSSGPRTPTTRRWSRSTAGGRRSSGCGRGSRSSCTATARRCGRSPTTATSPAASCRCSATRARSARPSTSPPTTC